MLDNLHGQRVKKGEQARGLSPTSEPPPWWEDPRVTGWRVIWWGLARPCQKILHPVTLGSSHRNSSAGKFRRARKQPWKAERHQYGWDENRLGRGVIVSCCSGLDQVHLISSSSHTELGLLPSNGSSTTAHSRIGPGLHP
eukprot:364953-Chlamydomonas_euryale.AAC.10